MYGSTSPPPAPGGAAGIDWCINITISPLSHKKCRVFHLCSFSSLWACRASFTAFLELGWTTFLQWTFDFPSLGWKKTRISLQSYCSVHLLDEFVKKEHVRVSFYPLDFDRKQTNNTHLTVRDKLASFWKGLRNYKLKTFSAQLNDQFIDILKTGPHLNKQINTETFHRLKLTIFKLQKSPKV